jgi:uncharacterized membrane protein YdbT with pleckstrin-like domain
LSPTIRKHWIILVRPLVIPAAVLVAIAVLVNVLGAGPIDSLTRTVVTLALAVAVVVWALVAWLVRLSSSLTLTNQRVIQEEGILRRTSSVIPVDRIQDISIVQSIGGRLLGYGDIEIDTAGAAAKEVFTYVPRPQEVRDQLFVALAQRRGGPTLPSPQDP